MVIKTTPGFFGFSSKHGNNKRNQKAQMKVKQMVFMLIAVTVLLTMVGLFVITIRINTLELTASVLEEENAKLLVSKLANSPEFFCEESFEGQRANCVDFDKIMVLKENIEKYEDFWGVSKIELRIIYSLENSYERQEIECEYNFETGEGNYPGCNYVQLMDKPSNGNDFSNYVSVCKRIILPGEEDAQTVCNLGKLIVRYEDVQI